MIQQKSSLLPDKAGTSSASTTDPNRELIKLIQQGTPQECSAAMTELIKQNMHFLTVVAHRYHARRHILDTEDLVQAGATGLIVAAQRFDMTQDVKFMTYAGWYVKKYITDEMCHAEPGWDIHKRDMQPFYRMVKCDSSAEFERLKTELPAAQFTGLTNILGVQSLDQNVYQTVDPESATTLLDVTADAKQDYSETIVKDMCQSQLSEDLWSFYKTHVSPKTYHVLRSYYIDGKTLDAIAKEYGVSRQSIHQLVTRAVKSYRHNPQMQAIGEHYL